jgi:hypothetical protein
MFFVALGIAFTTRTEPAVADWGTLRVLAYRDYDINLSVSGIETEPKFRVFRVLLVDGKKRYVCGLSGVYLRHPVDRVYNIRGVLRKMSRPPSKKAYVIVEPVDPKVRIRFGSVRVTPAKR